MDALIIAAGFGSRLREVSDSKPLTPIAGVPLLELGVRQAKAAGARAWWWSPDMRLNGSRPSWPGLRAAPGLRLWRSGSLTGRSPTAIR